MGVGDQDKVRGHRYHLACTFVDCILGLVDMRVPVLFQSQMCREPRGWDEILFWGERMGLVRLGWWHPHSERSPRQDIHPHRRLFSALNGDDLARGPRINGVLGQGVLSLNV